MQIAPSPSPNRLTSSLTNATPQPVRLQILPGSTETLKSSSSSTTGGGATGLDASTTALRSVVTEVVPVSPTENVSFPSLSRDTEVILGLEGACPVDAAGFDSGAAWVE